MRNGVRRWTSPRLGALAIAATVAGCIPRSSEATYASAGPAPPGYSAGYGYGPPAALPYPAPASPWTMPAAPAWTPVSVAPEATGRPGQVGARIPGGDRCLAELDRLGVAHQDLEPLKGVTTPVRVTGPIGGIAYRAVAGLPFVCDCRLAVALAGAASDLAALGVRELRYSGVYVDRTTRQGKPSLHARGLAIDLHAAVVGNDVVTVKHDFRRGLPDGCVEGSPVLNQLACRLRAHGLFKQLLTPDSNADHHDHLHLGVAPID